jgi:hypothetical protein
MCCGCGSGRGKIDVAPNVKGQPQEKSLWKQAYMMTGFFKNLSSKSQPEKGFT